MVPAATTEEQSPRRNDLSHASLFGSFLHLYADISFASLLLRLYGRTNIHSVLCLSSSSNNGVRVLEFNSVKVDVYGLWKLRLRSSSDSIRFMFN